MKAYEVTYGFGLSSRATGAPWSTIVLCNRDPKSCFIAMASQTFGLRKNMGDCDKIQCKKIDVPMDMELPKHGDFPWDAAIMLGQDRWSTFKFANTDCCELTPVVHDGDIYGVPEDQLIGAARITGRRDYEQLAQELKLTPEIDLQF